jgi:hypothetical protein
VQGGAADVGAIRPGVPLAKGVTRRAHRGPWCARSSPRGPTHLASASEPNRISVGGWVSPLGDSLSGGGGSEEEFQGGKPSRGRRGAPFANLDRQ